MRAKSPKCGALRLFAQILCGALFVTSPSFANEGLKTASLRYEATADDTSSFPEGCENPYKDVNDFIEFYNDSINEVVVSRGPKAHGVADLYAVSELVDEVRELFPNLSDESPIDRLIISQLCQFQKIRLQQRQKAGRLRPEELTSSNAELHEHLMLIAPKLYHDSRKLLVEALGEQSKLKDRLKILAAKRAEIRKAREEGRLLIDDLFSSNKH